MASISRSHIASVLLYHLSLILQWWDTAVVWRRNVLCRFTGLIAWSQPVALFGKLQNFWRRNMPGVGCACATVGGTWGFIVGSHTLFTFCFLTLDVRWPSSLLLQLPYHAFSAYCHVFPSKVYWIPLELCVQISPFSLKLSLSGDFCHNNEEKIALWFVMIRERKESKKLTFLAIVWTLFLTKAAGLKDWFLLCNIWGGSGNSRSGLSEGPLHCIGGLEGPIGFNPLLSASGHLCEKLCPPLFRPFCSASPLGLKSGLSNVEWSETRMQINASFKLLSQAFSLTHWLSHYFFQMRAGWPLVLFFRNLTLGQDRPSSRIW